MTTTIKKLVKTSTLFTATIASLILAAYPSVSDAERWELRTAPDTVPGTLEIESGKIDKAIRISKVQLPHVGQRKKVAVLTNLCIGHILSDKLDQAEEFCDRAVERPNDKAVSYNNRGVLKILQGDYEGAMQDFASATNSGCFFECSNVSDTPKDLPRSVAQRNFGKAKYQAKATNTESVEQIAARTN